MPLVNLTDEQYELLANEDVESDVVEGIVEDLVDQVKYRRNWSNDVADVVIQFLKYHCKIELNDLQKKTLKIRLRAMKIKLRLE